MPGVEGRSQLPIVLNLNLCNQGVCCIFISVVNRYLLILSIICTYCFYNCKKTKIIISLKVKNKSMKFNFIERKIKRTQKCLSSICSDQINIPPGGKWHSVRHWGHKRKMCSL